MTDKKIIVIGAGFGGLAAAALLAKNGYDVTILEKNSQPGGRAMVYQDQGYSFDMGPSWYMMLEAFDRYFAEFKKKTSDFYETIRLDPSYRVFFGKDDFVDIHADIADNYPLFDKLEPDGAHKLKRYLEKSKHQYNLALNNFIYRDYDTLPEIVNKDIFLKGLRLNIYKSFENYTRAFFISQKARKLIEYSIAFVGGGPAISPAVYSLLSHADLNLGIWYPLGGIGKIIDSLVQLGKQHGVEIKVNHEVQHIRVKDKQATGVDTTKDFFPADGVLVSADYHHTETQLLDPQYQSYPEKYWEKKVLAPAGFRIFIGLDKKLDMVRHHSLYFNKDWDSYFAEVYGAHTAWPQDPSYYVCCPSKNDPSVAPAGGECFSILVLVAPGLEDTPEIRESYSNQILDHFEQLMGENINDSIVVKKIFTINDYMSTYNAYKGTALGMAHTLRQTAMLRPKHHSKKVKNLYYCGHYTHPGIGVPVTLISAQLATQKMVTSLKN